jgi:hypothetical protein
MQSGLFTEGGITVSCEETSAGRHRHGFTRNVQSENGSEKGKLGNYKKDLERD